jgi:hypothetical protein
MVPVRDVSLAEPDGIGAASSTARRAARRVGPQAARSLGWFYEADRCRRGAHATAQACAGRQQQSRLLAHWTCRLLHGASARIGQQSVPICLPRRVGVAGPHARCVGGGERPRLDDDLMVALVELRKLQSKESEKAETAYGAGLEDLDWYIAGDEYAVTDELGILVHPETYSDEFTRMLILAGLPKIRLHDSRHTSPSLMEKAGVPISIICKWAGHYDSSFTMRTLSTRTTRTCSKAVRRSPRFTASTRHVRDMAPSKREDHPHSRDDVPWVRIRDALGGTRTPNLLIRRSCSAVD